MTDPITSTRREVLLAAAAGSAILGTAGSAASAADLAAARKKAARRKRRIIYNNDGDDIWTQGADTVEKFLAVRHDPLLDTQVDSVYYCTTQSFNLFTHGTRVAEQFLVREASFAHNNLGTFLRQGTDGLRMSCEFARRHGLEAIWTLRMNDIHDAFTPQFLSRWKKEDPRRIMSTPEAAGGFNDRRRLWTLADFEHPDVEPRLVAIVEEVLRNYPVDGIELDWLRAPLFFRSHYQGGEVTGAQRDRLTGIAAALRRVVLRESERQGKPFLLAARVPVSEALCRRVGIDVAAWLEAGLVDVLAISGGYVVFDQPMRELIQLGHRHDVPVTPCVSQSGLVYRAPRGNGEVCPPAAWAAAAQRCWDAGADGIYVFNLFAGPYSDWKDATGRGSAEAQKEYARTILRHVGAPGTLRKLDAAYAISDAGGHMPSHFWAKDAEEFSRALPLALPPGVPTELPPLVVAARREALRGRDPLELRVDLAGLPREARVDAALNGVPLESGLAPVPAAQVLRFRWPVRRADVRPGQNRLVLTPSGAGAQAVGVELWIERAAPA